MKVPPKVTAPSTNASTVRTSFLLPGNFVVGGEETFSRYFDKIKDGNPSVSHRRGVSDSLHLIFHDLFLAVDFLGGERKDILEKFVG